MGIVGIVARRVPASCCVRAIWRQGLVPYFETMTDAVFTQHRARGVTSREAAIISRAERDGDLVSCVGESQFLGRADCQTG